MEGLPMPRLERVSLRDVTVLTDVALFESAGVRIAFTGRMGGVSHAPYDSLNLGSHVGDVLDDVQANRQIVLDAVGGSGAWLLTPNQVHGTQIEQVCEARQEAIDVAASNIAKGCDGLVVTVSNVAAMLCFADCAPVIIVSPTGAFSVVHAGWRGAVAGIVGKAVDRLAADCQPSELNMYIGPHIHAECFETGPDVSARFIEAYGQACVPDPRHVSLAQAVRLDAQAHGVSEQRIIDVGICTMCNPGLYYSYRHSKGVCGRHGALAFRK